MNKTSTNVLFAILIAIIIIGSVYLLGDFRSEKQLPESIEPTEISQDIAEPETSEVTESETALVEEETPVSCSKTPYVESYGKNSINNEPAIQEYVIPINCDQLVVFKRQDDATKTNEWGGSFGVYIQEDNHNTYLFDHLGLLIDIAGGETWSVTEEGELLHFELRFTDMGSSQKWDYYINSNSKKLVAGFDASIGVDILTQNKVTQIKLNTTPPYCQTEDDIQVTDMIMIDNEEVVTLASPISELCQNRPELSFLPGITVSKIDLGANTVTLSIPENGDYTYNFKTFALTQ